MLLLQLRLSVYPVVSRSVRLIYVPWLLRYVYAVEYWGLGRRRSGRKPDIRVYIVYIEITLLKG